MRVFFIGIMLMTACPVFSNNVFLNINKGFYLSGQIIQYDLTITDRKDEINPVNKVFQINLIYPNGQESIKKLVKSNGGSYSGSIILPDDLPTAYYFLEVMEYNTKRQIMTVFIPVFNPKEFDSKNKREMSKDQSAGFEETQLLYDKMNANITPSSEEQYEIDIIASNSANSLTEFSFKENRKMNRDILKWYVSISNNFEEQKTTSPLQEQNLFPTFFVSKDYFLFKGKEDFLTVSGKITNDNGVPLNQILLTMVVDQEDPIIKSSFSQEDGKFEFNGLDFYGEKQLNFNFTYDFKNEKPVITLLNKFIESNYSGELVGTIPIVTSQIEKALIKDSLYAVYLNSFRTNEIFLRESKFNSDINSSNSIKADFEYNLIEYNKFEDVSSMFKELVSTVSVRKQTDSGAELRIFSTKINENFEDSPVFLIDGFLVKDVNEVLNMDVSFFERISIISDPTKLFHYGPTASNGLIIINTKKTLLNSYQDNYRVKTSGYASIESQKINTAALNSKPTVPLLINDLGYFTKLKNKKNKVLTFPIVIPDNYHELTITLTGLTTDFTKIDYKFSLDEIKK